jgi:hypothetical protein
MAGLLGAIVKQYAIICMLTWVPLLQTKDVTGLLGSFLWMKVKVML